MCLNAQEMIDAKTIKIDTATTRITNTTDPMTIPAMQPAEQPDPVYQNS